jgi:hypothetical protein
MKAEIYNGLKIKNEFNKKTNYYNFGEKNNTPEQTKKLIENSSTARYCSNQMVQYLIGKGIGELDDYLINPKLRLYDFLEQCAKSKVNNSGIYIGVAWSYNLEKKTFFISDLKVIPFERCRIGKEDDNEYSGKICVYKDISNKKDSEIWYDVYNDNQAVIQEQITKAGSFSNYKGQILFVSDDDSEIYPNSRISGSSLMDCENEILIAKYKNEILKNGFFGKTLILTKPLIDSSISEFTTNEEGAQILNFQFQNQKDERQKFKETIKSFMGSENIGGALHLEVDFNSDEIDKEVKFEHIESKIDPNLFLNIETATVTNICKAFNNFPIGLLLNSSGGLNASGEQINQLKVMFWENTEKERNQLERLINKLWLKFENFNGKYIKILTFIKETNNLNFNNV